MKCPICADAKLTMAERNGIEIDYCADCRGVWLDRGELDKLIERAGSRPEQTTARDAERHSPRRKKSMLREIFDFE